MYWLHGPVEIDRSQQPFYSIFRPFYESGWMGVDLFFVLSGFIFYWLYAQGIQERRVGLVEFGLKRFSRLYPIHALMLAYVAGVQAFMVPDFVFPASSATAFAKHLMLVQSWTGIRDGYSFNGPAWSISVEVFLYGVFWMLCRVKLGSSAPVAFAMVVLGAALSFLSGTIGQCVACFFAGGLTCYFWRGLALREAKLPSAVIVGLTVLAWVGVAFWGEMNAPVRLIIFAATVLSLALCETRLSVSFRKFTWLGKISYSSYLLHFPLQLTAAAMVSAGVLSETTARSSAGFLVFFAGLIGLSYLSYIWLERPAQNFIRTWALKLVELKQA